MYLADINDDIISDLEAGVAECSKNYPKIVQTLNGLNPNAKILFYNVFNPYKAMNDTDGDGTLKIYRKDFGYKNPAVPIRVECLPEGYIVSYNGTRILDEDNDKQLSLQCFDCKESYHSPII